jgi:hypothetical protein
MASNKLKQKQKNDNFFDHVISWIGSVPSLVAHSIFFLGSFSLYFFGVQVEEILLVVTTLVSLEAIYLAIFIQMAVNRAAASLEEVEEDIDEIQEDVDEIEKDIDDIQEDVDEIQKDDEEEEKIDKQNVEVLNKIENKLQSLIAEIERIKKT